MFRIRVHPFCCYSVIRERCIHVVYASNRNLSERGAMVIINRYVSRTVYYPILTVLLFFIYEN